MRIVRLFLAMLVALPVASAAIAQTYPKQPVKIVVPYPPGGTNDILGRLMAERLSRAFGQSFVVENRSGAGGLVGTESVSRAPADGHTLLLASSAPLAVGLALYPKVPYDVARDFSPVAMIADVTMVLVASPSFQPRTVDQLVSLAKSKPGEVKAALNSLGSMGHLVTELFRLRTSTKVTMVPYKGTGPALTDLMGGHVDIDFENLPAVVSHIKDGRVHALATASPERSDLLPDVPTLKELGLTDLVASSWFALLAPAGTPTEIVSRLNQEVAKILQSAEMRKLLAAQGANPIESTSEQTGAFLKAEIAKWAQVVKESGAKLE